MSKNMQMWMYLISGALFVTGAIMMLVYSFGGVPALFPVGLIIGAVAAAMLVTMHVVQKRGSAGKGEE